MHDRQQNATRAWGKPGRVALALLILSAVPACSDVPGLAGTGSGASTGLVPGHDHTHDHGTHSFFPGVSTAPGTDGTGSDATGDQDGYNWKLPPGFPVPKVPADNPMSQAKVKLGRRLFYDKSLSINETQSCESCHFQSLAFTDGLAISAGATGDLTPRSSMTLANVGYAASLTWANPLHHELERQALIPLFGDNPFELALRSAKMLEDRLRAKPVYLSEFLRAFPGEIEPITTRNATRALASFQRTLISGNSPFDRWMRTGDASGMTPDAIRGFELFNSEKFECFHCHAGFNFSDHITYRDQPFESRKYHNNGLYNIDGKGGYPAPNTGVHDVSQDLADMGRFKVPTLRNIALTAPYMHDGSIATLSEVLEHYARGGRLIESGEFAGDGNLSPLKSEFVRPFDMTPEEKAQVIAFLHSLTDESFLTDERFKNPWIE